MDNDGDHGRYARQLLLKEMGAEGMERLSSARAVVVGCGALGSTAADLLARSGTGTLVLVDRDLLVLSNLQRQTLYDETDLDRPKAMAAVERLHQVNPDIELVPVVKDLDPWNIEDVLKGADVVVDGTDNMETRFLINDICLELGIPWVYGGAISTNGMSMTIMPGRTPCFACAFPRPPPPGILPTCDSVGVLNTVTTVVGAIEATEALKVMLGHGPRPGLLVLDLWTDDHWVIDVRTRSDCPACQKGERRYLRPAEGRTRTVTTLCGRDAVQVSRPSAREGIDLRALADRLSRVGTVTVTSIFLKADIEAHRLTIFKDGRCIIKGTDNSDEALAIYSRYIGD